MPRGRLAYITEWLPGDWDILDPLVGHRFLHHCDCLFGYVLRHVLLDVLYCVVVLLDYFPRDDLMVDFIPQLDYFLPLGHLLDPPLLPIIRNLPGIWHELYLGGGVDISGGNLALANNIPRLALLAHVHRDRRGVHLRLQSGEPGQVNLARPAPGDGDSLTAGYGIACGRVGDHFRHGCGGAVDSVGTVVRSIPVICRGVDSIASRPSVD